jgi:hypothetical protein
MNRLYITIFLIMVSLCGLPAQSTALSEKWGDNTAYIKPAHTWETGVLQSFRLGLSDKLELRTNALLLPVLPNVGIKLAWGSNGGFIFASEHAVSYPTLFLQTVAMKGTGGLISPQYSFPFILAINNALIMSKPVGATSLVSADAGVCFSIRNGQPDYRSSIDLPLLYPRMAHYYQGISLRAGSSFKGMIASRLFYEESVRLFVITRSSDNVFAENAGTLMWAVGKSLRIKAGYCVTWGRYPFGNQFNLMPTLDLVFGSKIK